MDTTFDQREAEWIKEFLAKGHRFVLQDPDPEYDGPNGPGIDWFVTNYGFHNGPACHCTQPEYIPTCGGTDA